jgi:starch phosphorylase
MVCYLRFFPAVPTEGERIFIGAGRSEAGDRRSPVTDMREEELARFGHVPERISGLVELAYNLWWSWHPAARMLFKQINRQAWKESIHNPVRMLLDLPGEFLERAADDPRYLHRYDLIMDRFFRYLRVRSSWFSEQHPERKPLTIAYFSAEYGLHHSLPFYAGGLGFLAGDHLKECSDLGLPMVAVGFMYAEGYLHQHIAVDGWQENVREVLNRDAAPITRMTGPDGRQMVVRVPQIEPPIHCAVWKVQVGRVPLYLLDTDIPENTPENRIISHRLYSGERELRLRQEIVLGIGGWHVLNRLGIRYSAVHLNEGHPAFALLERVRERIEGGMDAGTAIRQVKGTSVFTTHTPVAAGHDIFPADLIDRYLAHYYPLIGMDRGQFFALGMHPEQKDAGFNMTVFAMRMSDHHNAVSRRHGVTTRRMWRSLWPDLPEEAIPVDVITNGIHIPTWLNPRMEGLYDRHIGETCPFWQEEQDNPLVWELIGEIPDEELWNVHMRLKIKLFNRIRDQKRRKWAFHQEEPLNLVAEGMLLDPSALTIGFARRFSTYKRADLIFHDTGRLRRILTNRWRPVQLIFAGKAHPADEEGKRILQRIYSSAQKPEYEGRIAFVEDYGEQMAQYLVHGVDVWLNNPLPPFEACGTSGMKASLNGVLNLSILDGWWPEAFNGRNGWAFGLLDPGGNRDAADARAIYDLIEHAVAPLYYSQSMDGIPHEWIAMMKESIRSNAPRFSSRRMIKEYVARYYPSVRLHAGTFGLEDEIAGNDAPGGRPGA